MQGLKNPGVWAGLLLPLALKKICVKRVAPVTRTLVLFVQYYRPVLMPANYKQEPRLKHRYFFYKKAHNYKQKWYKPMQ